MTIPNSGPPYPPSPGTGIDATGSNAIGSAVIGESPIGDITVFNPWLTIESQYANSPILTSYLLLYAQALDQTRNFESFFDNIWNIGLPSQGGSANGYGLDVWGRIVGVTRVIKIVGLPVFGFEESGTAYGFNQGMFYTGYESTQNYTLNDEQFLRLILAKARSNITNDSIPAINNILMNLFLGRGNCWVQDNGAITSYFAFEESGSGFGFGQAPFYTGSGSTAVMGMTYVFTFPLTPVDIGIINSGVLPKPGGVPAAIAVIPPEF